MDRLTALQYFWASFPTAATHNVNIITGKYPPLSRYSRLHIPTQDTIYRRLRIGRDVHLDQSEAYDISQLVREYGPGQRKHS